MADDKPHTASLPDLKREAKVRRQFEAQNALHGAFAEAWMRMGGMEHLVDWGKENPDTFYRIFARMTPGLVPTNAINGDVNIHVHPLLKPGPLDNAVDADYEEIDDAETPLEND